ncbi:gp58-like protein [Alloiococcus otitis]|uniref:Gp58-like domain-containing protein n=1 Tax=Alloiococcus otitis ATCC 51267 TaxID=883081 RepID=K9EC34_9LACT|nr:gp58-like family protein [Alloiococcus otitis]EKU93356.1 hypothetical protein HMPREF9698_01104 [Alloiococcus otitis ATCC 51267]SUU81573.1 gp58-like protein [Alloiococcus otitis]
MEVIVGNQSVPVREGPDGRLQATFRATEETNRVIIPSDCIGALHVDDIQLEEGLRATPYTEPKVFENDISGIFKDLRDLNLKIDDTENGLQTQIKINQSGLEQQIEDTQKGLTSRLIATADIWQNQLEDTEQNLRSAMQQTSDSLITLIEDTDEENFSQTVQLVNGLQSTVEGQLRSQQTQLEGLIASTVESATGANSLIWQTLDSHGAQITSAQGDINSIEQRADSAHSRISDVEGNQSQITQTVDALDSRISNVNGDVSRLTQTVNGLSYDVHNANGTLKTEIRNLAGQIQSKVSRGEMDSIIRSSGDSIWLAVGDRVENAAQNSKMNGEDIVSEINLSPSGVRISGENLHVSAQTVIEGGIITNEMLANNISANKLTSGEINANQVRIINLDVNSLTGDKGRFVQLGIQGLNRNIDLNGQGLHIYRNDGSRSNLLSERGIEFWRDGNDHGQMSTLQSIDNNGIFQGKYSVSLAAEHTAYVSLAFSPQGSDQFYRALGVDGQTGRIIMDNLYPNSGDEMGFKFTHTLSDGRRGPTIKNSLSNNNDGLMLTDQGEVEILGDTLLFKTWRTRSSIDGQRGLELVEGDVSGYKGLFLWLNNANQAGIFFADNGYVFVRNTQGSFNRVTPGFN